MKFMYIALSFIHNLLVEVIQIKKSFQAGSRFLKTNGSWSVHDDSKLFFKIFFYWYIIHPAHTGVGSGNLGT